MTNEEVIAKLVVARDAAKVQYDTLNEILLVLVPAPGASEAGCKHENREDITAAGDAKTKYACTDCGHTWEADDAS